MISHGKSALRPEQGQRAKHSRYHLWFTPPSQAEPHGAQPRPSAVTGAPGTRLLGKNRSGVSSGVYSSGVSLLFSPCRGSLYKAGL